MKTSTSYKSTIKRQIVLKMNQIICVCVFIYIYTHKWSQNTWNMLNIISPQENATYNHNEVLFNSH